MNPHRINPFSLVAWAVTAVVATAGANAPAIAQDVDLSVFDLSKVDLTAEELAIWEDPDFRRRFVESYIAETDLEPKPVSVDEVNVINETLKLMSPPTEEELAAEAEAKKKDKPRRLFGRNEEPEPEAEPIAQDPGSRLKRALSYVTQQREANPNFSVLIDFLAANLRLNIAMNLDEFSDGEGEPDQATASRKRFMKKYLLKKAAEGYRTCTIKHAKYRRAWRNLGIVSLRLQDYTGARDAFQQVIMLGGGDPDTYGLLGFCYTTLGDHLPAESAFRMANLLDPDKKDWRMGLIRSFLLQKRYPEAVALSAKMLEDEPTNDRLWLFQANAYIGMEQFDKASENYEILDGLGKSTVQSLSMLANIYTNQGLFDTAVQRYQQAIELASPEQRESMLPRLFNAARVLSSHGEPSRDATKAMIKTIETKYSGSIKDKDLTALLRLSARIALAEGADDRQAGILEEVVKLDPLDGEALILLGQHYTRLQEWPRAIGYYERAANIEGFEADAKVRHAQALVLSDRAAQALPLLREAQQIKPRESVQQYLEAVERMSR
ncbi:MAG: tetratricopeptide repeat protein [Phycisphaeraceae bacterium]|nr:tetratricopeptide repeat protein [Phycisphaeraceae bacterium]